MRGQTLPRIDSAGGLDQLEAMVAAQCPGASSGPHPVDENAVVLVPPEAAPADAGTQGASGVGYGAAPGHQNRNPGPTYDRGDLVEVDFDDEGWFRGIVESRSQNDRGTYMYHVRLSDGEIAEDVEGSEIRSLRELRELGGGGSSEDGEGEGSVYAHTRSDALSGFDQRSLVATDSPEAARFELPQMTVRATDSGVEWNFIDDEQINWSPPTEALLEMRIRREREREELNRSPP